MAKQADHKTDHVTEETNHVSTRPNYFSTAPGKGWLYGAGAFFLLLIAFAMGSAAAGHDRLQPGRTVLGGPHVGFERHMRTGGGQGLMESGTSTSDGQSRTQGVVTSVNGSNFTIAAHGWTTNVTTNSSTKYQNGNQVKQNDSVIIFGTEANGTLTATQIVINP
ncbi:hypothetical protein KW792_02555 [Candidatus Saccharibacteria bacterium]|nr:hypothetical protein [Candidatus Saccharibacteria bacterium]